MAAMQGARIAAKRAVVLAVGDQVDPRVAEAVVELATAITALNLALSHLLEPEVEARANYKN